MSRRLSSLQTALGRLGDCGWEHNGLVIKGLCELGLQGLDPFIYFVIRSYNKYNVTLRHSFPDPDIFDYCEMQMKYKRVLRFVQWCNWSVMPC